MQTSFLRNRVLKLVKTTIVLAAISFKGTAFAQTIISVDFYGTAASENRLAPSDIAGAGPYAAANWNLVSGSSTNTPAALNNSTGAVTPVSLSSVSVTTPGGGLGRLDTAPITGDQKLYEGNVSTDIWWASPGISFTLSGLEAFSSYDLVVYLTGMPYQDPTRRGSITTSAAGSPTYYSVSLGTSSPQPGNPSANYVQVTSNDIDTPTVGNYVVFSGLTDAILTASYTAVNNVTGITGFQIIGTPVPEPATAVLLAAGGAVLAMARRRR